MFTKVETKLKESNGCAIVSDGFKNTQRNNKSLPVARGSKEVASMKERINCLR